MPDFTVFTQIHPHIHLEISTTFDMPDLEWREVDVAIRISNNPPNDLIGRRVLRIARAAYVCEDYFPSAKHDKQLPPLSWIGWSTSPSNQNWYENSKYPELPVNTIISDPYTTVKAIQAGMGMSILPCFMGDSEPELFRMPPENLILHTDIWVLTHPDLRNNARIRIFTNFIVSSIERHQDLLEGNRTTQKS